MKALQKYARFFILLVLILSIQSCASNRTKPADEALSMPERYSRRTSVDGYALTGRWWEAFNDTILNKLMEQAFDGNIDLSLAFESLKKARASSTITRSALWPQVNLKAGGGKARQSGLTAKTYSLSAEASFELDLWSRLSSMSSAQRFETLATQADIKAFYLTLSAQVADLYYKLKTERAQLELAQKSALSFEDTFMRVEIRYRAGIAPALDLHQSRQSLLLARARAVDFEARVSTTKTAIFEIMGRFPNAALTDIDSTLPEPPAFKTSLPANLITNRPDIESALLRIKASNKRLGAAISARLPIINLIGAYGGASSELSNILKDPNIFWNLLIQGVMPLVDGSRRKAEVKIKETELSEALLNYKKILISAFIEVEDAITKGRANMEKVDLLRKRMESARSSLQLSTEDYMQGLVDYLPVLDAQQRFYNSQSELINAKGEYISDRITLARSLGGPWTKEVFSKRDNGQRNRKGRDEKK